MKCRPAQQGFSYLALLILIAVLGVTGTATVLLGEISERRQAEQALLLTGSAYRNAIASYYNAVPAEKRHYPRALADLLRDPRFPLRRHLRRLYPDPISGQADWLLLRGPDGGIMGIASRSTAQPIKLDLFDEEDSAFKQKRHYSEWLFVADIAPKTPRILTY
ncbi:type II secretion system protein [Chitinimonas arctica]|uniref:Type II secretion system protein n=1 Tax=Chitinimonas arctica TaxID=2594795 RepID=A0A516SBT3_9NEIS|nr:type II secretion system protein [Chitinimonas arctica]QDQ25603.1 type II secretion system protein [Chitinimonas arctica]